MNFNNQKENNEILVSLKYLKKIYHLKNHRKWLKIAIERKIVPFRASPQLTQICGHLIGDGYLRLTKKAGGRLKFFGNPSKLKEIAKIYEKLFNKKIKLVERDNGPGYKLEFADSIVVRCLHKIGVPSGDKVLTKFGIPFWILNGNREIKRKFIQAIVDDELETLCKHKDGSNSWTGLRLKMNKSEKLLPDILKFFNQIILILKEFGIETTEAKIYKNVSYIRGDGTKTYSAVFRIRNYIENRRKFFKEIGFIYDKKKQQRLIDSLINFL